jgi:hypothetical protein
MTSWALFGWFMYVVQCGKRKLPPLSTEKINDDLNTMSRSRLRSISNNLLLLWVQNQRQRLYSKIGRMNPWRSGPKVSSQSAELCVVRPPWLVNPILLICKTTVYCVVNLTCRKIHRFWWSRHYICHRTTRNSANFSSISISISSCISWAEIAHSFSIHKQGMQDFSWYSLPKWEKYRMNTNYTRGP